ncbi:hypothetical protein K353_01054 [Kitasatospora sp. SolWspMP-SS2h]|uniref:DUF3040 domain-containing protein n=1 Tax=Kitasatospora sp. SolWspMP-SS2h TaxID=1305729 RepID=UPI000DBFE422|nr:DUF3040 domain-containing protein [Kitasatospora sp. SolWspMP-SS2h]RAJ45555.1 hypothetical protein K353_01054 [Kitasatospora sp. SolWspMP-SS2h]
MDTRLTPQERLLLAEIEQHLRRTDPRLDRRLDHPPGPAARLGHRPVLLVAAVALLTTVTAAGALWAGAGGPHPLAAVLLAAATALLAALALRRLARLRLD